MNFASHLFGLGSLAVLRATPFAASTFLLLTVAIRGARCLHFGTLRVHFGNFGAPWRTMGAAGWTQGGPEQDFHRFWFDFGTHFEFCLAPTLEISFCSGLFPGHFLYWFLIRKLTHGAPDAGFRVEVLQNPTFDRNRFLWISGLICIVCWKPWEQFF